MFNTWLSRKQNLSNRGKTFHVIFDQNRKRNCLKQNALLKHYSELPKKTESPNFPFFNRSFDKKKLKSLFSWYYANRGEALTFSLVEKIQKLGFSYAMKAGISLGVDDLKVPPTKNESLTEAVELLANTKALVNSGNVTALEEFQQFVDTWHRTSENLKTSVVQNFSRSSLGFVKKSKVIGVMGLGPKDPPKSPMPKDLPNSSKPSIHPYSLLRDQDKNPAQLKNETSSKNLSLLDAQSAKQEMIISSWSGPSDWSSEVGPSDPNPTTITSESPKPLFEQKKVLHKKSQPSFQHSNKKYKPKTKTYSKNILNPVYMMAFSGARGNISQVRQLVGMRGLMADPQGQLVEFPIQSNFREGLTVTEYMISCYGARKGLVDTALRTAAAGYLTRRLVDVSHHQIVRFVTCSTKNSIFLFDGNKKEKRSNLLPSAWKVSPIAKESEIQKSTTSNFKNSSNPSRFVKDALPLLLDKKNKTSHQSGVVRVMGSSSPSPSDVGLKDPTTITSHEPNKQEILFNSIRTSSNKTSPPSNPLVFCVGRVLARDIPGIAFRNQEIDISLAASPLLKKIYEENGIHIRSPLTCTSESGICQLCYGWSVSHNRLVGLGEAVGIIAAQSIGEPGTQLTMRTFHTGGVFSGDIMEECRAKHHGIVHFQTIYLGLLVRTAGGAVSFCLKTPAIFQIKGSNETTTYNVSANTLLFVRQGEKVIKDSLLAQIPNLPTIEENSGESTKTIVSELSGEVRQKETVNPQLASFRILAGQEYTQFYFFNYDFSSNSPLDHRRKEFSSHYLSEELFKPHKKQFKQFKQEGVGLGSFGPKKDPTNPTINFFALNKKNDGRVNMSWGAHRLGNNETFWLNINGSKSQVILPLGDASSKQFMLTEQTTHKITSKNANENYHPSLSIVPTVYSPFVNQIEKKTQKILSDLRIFVACKIHENPVLATSCLERSNNKVSNKMLTSLYLNAKEGKQNVIDNQSFSLRQGLFKLLFHKKKTFPNLKKKQGNLFLEYFSLQKVDNLFLRKLTYFFSEKTSKNNWQKNAKKNKGLEIFNLNSKDNQSLPFFGINQFQHTINKNSVRFKSKLLDNSIKKIATLSSWPNNYRPNMFYYCCFFWTLKDLVFLTFLTRNKDYSQLRVIINKKWWGDVLGPKGPTSEVGHGSRGVGPFGPTSFGPYRRAHHVFRTQFDNSLTNERLSLTPLVKGIQLNERVSESQKNTIIKVFPDLSHKLFYRFNNLNQFQTIPLAKKLNPTNKNLSTSSCSKQSLKLQDSGEIFPFQGNTKVTDFQLLYQSFQKVSNLNSGLLMHYNRVSYKLPLCNTNDINSSLSISTLKVPIKAKERLVFIRSMLAQLSKQNQNEKAKNRFLTNKSFNLQEGPQIGDFINTGDEIVEQIASAHCGQVIEKSPVSLTLRLTQNILYPNLRNRPAKIEKNVKNGKWISKGAPLVTLPYISNVTGDIVAGIPKIEQLFEARGETLDETINKIWDAYKVSIVPRSKAVRECFKEIGLFVVAAIQKVYSSQGVHIADKHLEVIVRQMTRRALIVDPGDTEFLPEEFVDLNTIECVNWTTYGNNATYRPRLIGITKASLTSNSFLSSASFQQTARVLERETILEKTDRLLGLKERVMMGALINAGTGELKTTVQLSDRSRPKSLSTKLVKRLNFFSRRKVNLHMAYRLNKERSGNT